MGFNDGGGELFFTLLNEFHFTSTRICGTMSDTLHNRGNALENQFFSKLDSQLLDELKAKQELVKSIDAVSKMTGINDRGALEAILKFGFEPQTLVALRVFPLVAVAWADGTMEDGERATVKTLAASHLHIGDSAVTKLLDNWLSQQPTNEMFAAWEGYAAALVAAMSVEEANALKAALINEIRVVAEASGGLLGWGAVSKGESGVMKRIEAALTRNA